MSVTSRTYRTKVFLKSLYGAWRSRALFRQVQTFFLFIGNSSSGHTVVGSLLDAHPNIVVSIELHAVRFIEAGYSRSQILYLALAASQAMAVRGHRWRKHGSDFVFDVSSQWQGRHREVTAIGDKMGGATTALLGEHPELLSRLVRVMAPGGHVKFLHVVRNPFDNISRHYLKRRQSRERGLEYCVNRYFWHCDVVMGVKAQLGAADVLDVTHEALIQDPPGGLRRICEFLGVEPYGEYLRDCAKVVYRAPHQSRNQVQWDRALIERVSAACARYPFLSGYSFEK